MKKKMLMLMLLMRIINGYSQHYPDFKLLRYDENYSYLKKDSGINWYGKTKYAAPGKNAGVYFSFGGDARFQYLWYKHENWEKTDENKDGYTLARFLAHVDFHAGKHLRTYAELQSSMTGGKTSTTAVEDNPLELHQAFIDITLFSCKDKSILFRAGRQELSYGSQRLVSVRELPNNRQSFDALKAIFNFGGFKSDLFFSDYVPAVKGIFNDGFNKSTKFAGVYITKTNVPFIKNIDFYYLGLWKKKSTFDQGSGKETRHSVGGRIWNNNKPFNYDLEAVLQFGKFSGRQIRAWTCSVNINYQFNNFTYKPVLGLKTEIISGDKNDADKKLGTFNPLFPRGAYFGLAALIGPTNLTDIHPYISVTVRKGLVFSAETDIFWRYSNGDGIYGPNVALIYSGKNSTERFIGNQYAADLLYTPNHFLNFRCEFIWFNSGPFLKEVGPGKDILYTAFTTQLKF